MHLGDLKLREWISHHRGGGAGGSPHLPSPICLLSFLSFASMRKGTSAIFGEWISHVSSPSGRHAGQSQVCGPGSLLQSLLSISSVAPTHPSGSCEMLRGAWPGASPGQGVLQLPRREAQADDSESPPRAAHPLVRPESESPSPALRDCFTSRPQGCARTLPRRAGGKATGNQKRVGDKESRSTKSVTSSPKEKRPVSSVLISLVLSPFKRNARGRADLS